MQMISHWNVMLTTQDSHLNGMGSFIAGKTKSQSPTIEHGFLIYESKEGFTSGINLSEVLHFSLQPEFLE